MWILLLLILFVPGFFEILIGAICFIALLIFGIISAPFILIGKILKFLFSDEPSEHYKQKPIVTNDNYNDDNEESPNINTTMPNYYELLGVSKTASLDEIINAYEKKKAIIIDDYDTLANKKGKKLFEAYATLSDKESRAKYDEECRLYLHQHSGIYNNLVPMMKKNENLYNKTNSEEQPLNNKILVDSEEESNKTYYNWKRALIIAFGIAITHFLFKYFALH